MIWIAVIAALVLGFCRPVLTYAGDKTWTPAQKILATTFIAAATVDYFQTTSNLHKGGYERLGIETDTEALGIMGGLTAALLLVAHNNPKIRTKILAGGNVAVWSFVFFNNGIGVRISF
jgi:hypothetical protein